MTDITKPQVKFVTVDEDYAGQRIDNFLKLHLKGVPKSMLYRILRKGEVRVNKKRVKPEYKIQANDLVRVPPVRVSDESAPVNPKLTKVAQLENCIIHEDERIMVINKPSGIAVHGGSAKLAGEALAAHTVHHARCIWVVGVAWACVKEGGKQSIDRGVGR